jgi:N-acetyl-1-D-myo-inositol-2-amino-2-deoxy-alpha-D-glucopyranoside deacetylase
LPNGPRSRIAGVFAHPDDEAYFAGATLATYAAAGCDVRLATLTGGEVFGPVRLQQYAGACAALGAAESRRLRPGRWQDLGRTGAADSLAAAPLADVIAAIREFVAEVGPDVLITNDADGVTAHPDHVRVHEAILATDASVPVILAGCVRADDVATASHRLRSLAPGARIGSGGIRGVRGDGLLALDPTCPARKARAAALDLYHPGLGSEALEDLVDPATRVGDGILLRAIAEAAGQREFFRVL